MTSGDPGRVGGFPNRRYSSLNLSGVKGLLGTLSEFDPNKMGRPYAYQDGHRDDRKEGANNNHRRLRRRRRAFFCCFL